MQIQDSLKTCKATETDLNQVIELVTKTDEPLMIEGDNQTIVVITYDEWRAIQETLYLNSIPGFNLKFLAAVNESKLERKNALDLGLL